MYVTVDGQRAFFSVGSGRHDAANNSVLFIHGVGFDHTVWTLPARYFARQGLNVVAVDLPGHGRSAGAPLESTASMAEWLCKLLDELGIEQVSAVGHSMGSLVAMTLAATHAERVRNLVMLGVSMPMPVSDRLLESARQNADATIDMLNTWSHSSLGQQGGNENPGMSMTMSGQRLLERAGPGVFYADLAACHNFTDGAELAARLTIETLVILGLEDRMTRPGLGRALAAAIKGARVVELESCGHAMLSEQPNRVLDAMAEVIV